MSKFIKEFKEFAIKGNMVDLAVGIIIGAAFNEVVNTLVKKIIMPPLSLLTEGVNFQDKKLILRHAVMKGGKVIQDQVAIEIGTLITVLINFLIIAICMFFVVKIMNRLRAKSQDPDNKKVTTPKDIQLLSEMKGIMEEQNKLLSEMHSKNN